MEFVAAITFEIDGGRKRVYSLACGTAQDIAMMIDKFFLPRGLKVKTQGGFATQEDAHAHAQVMFTRAAQKHGRVEPEQVNAESPLFKAIMNAGERVN